MPFWLFSRGDNSHVLLNVVSVLGKAASVLTERDYCPHGFFRHVVYCYVVRMGNCESARR